MAAGLVPREGLRQFFVLDICLITMINEQIYNKVDYSKYVEFSMMVNVTDTGKGVGMRPN